jgi:formylglycine-generating enzyme required for sulfatase activity
VSSSASNQLSYECPGVKGIASRKGCPDPTQPSNAETITDTTVGIFILVKGGTFQMGNALQVPIHSVTLSDYYIGQTEVTQAQWRSVMGENPSGYGHCDACPVEQVSWERIQTFLTKLNNRSGGNKYRLPTEAEWEYAARGGKQSKGYTYSGSNDIDAVAWYDKNAGGKSHPIKGKTANELGLYDMSGNVLEWCSDWYGSYSSAFQTNPTGATSGSLRVYRDGSWYSGPEFCVVAYRGYGSPDLRGPNLGFRLAMAVTF